jgi:hypothetical protein
LSEKKQPEILSSSRSIKPLKVTLYLLDLSLKSLFLRAQWSHAPFPSLASSFLLLIFRFKPISC